MESKKKIDPGDPVDEDVYKLTPERRKMLGIKELPTTLRDALEEMKSDEMIHRTLGNHIFDAFIDHKTNDWNQYCLICDPVEIMKNLDYLKMEENRDCEEKMKAYIFVQTKPATSLDVVSRIKSKVKEDVVADAIYGRYDASYRNRSTKP